MEVKEECVKDGNGNVLSEGSEVCERWKEYFDGLLNVSESGRAEIFHFWCDFASQEHLKYRLVGGGGLFVLQSSHLYLQMKALD